MAEGDSGEEVERVQSYPSSKSRDEYREVSKLHFADDAVELSLSYFPTASRI